VSNHYQNRYGRSSKSNSISDNTININSSYYANGIYVAMADNTLILRNKITVVSERIIGVLIEYSSSYLSFGTLQTNNTQIVNNTINGTGGLVYLIESIGALNNIVKGNMLTSKSTVSYGYAGFESSGDLIESNTILVNGIGKFKGDKISTGQTGVYYSGGSSSNRVIDNYIVSVYVQGGDYAVYIAGNVIGFNVVVDNYLISDNGGKTADRAVYALFDVVSNNTPVYIFVSPKGSDTTGDGSKLKPFKSNAYAISQAYNRAVIYLLQGTYHENGLNIDKTITISALDGEAILNGDGKQMFYIALIGNLTINGLNITKSGIAFVNHGKLTINNSNISHNTATDEGGAILNYGDLSLIGSIFSYNSAYTGGSISNYGNLSISGCKMNYNSAVRGGVIYNNDTGSLNIFNSSFEHNSVTDNGGVIDNYGDLKVSKSLFKLNSAKNGGAIFSDSIKFTLLNSTFCYNEASNNGGAVSASMDEGVIDWSVFNRNTATSGGALMLSGGDIKITNSVISNNTAAYYAGLYYEGEVEWGHILYQLTIINCDLENNVAMVRGGAFGFADANVKISNSNIVNNFAPTYSTIYAPNYNINIDVRDNYWGLGGPDDSVWNTNNILFRDWLKDRSNWDDDGEPVLSLSLFLMMTMSRVLVLGQVGVRVLAVVLVLALALVLVNW
jgi:predicted outer membrane repeat protein